MGTSIIPPFDADAAPGIADDINTLRLQRYAVLWLENPNRDMKEAATSVGLGSRNPKKLLNEPVVVEFIRRHLRAAQIRAGVSFDRIVAEMSKIAFSSMGDYSVVQADGTMAIDLTNITADQAAAIQEITVDEYKEGRGEDSREIKRVKLKLHDKQKALIELARMLSTYQGNPGGDIQSQPKNVVNQPVRSIEEYSEDELRRLAGLSEE